MRSAFARSPFYYSTLLQFSYAKYSGIHSGEGTRKQVPVRHRSIHDATRVTDSYTSSYMNNTSRNTHVTDSYTSSYMNNTSRNTHRKKLFTGYLDKNASDGKQQARQRHPSKVRPSSRAVTAPPRTRPFVFLPCLIHFT